MKLFVLRKTQNGWIVTDDDGFLSPSDIERSHVFETMKALCQFLEAEVKKAEKCLK